MKSLINSEASDCCSGLVSSERDSASLRPSVFTLPVTPDNFDVKSDITRLACFSRNSGSSILVTAKSSSKEEAALKDTIAELIFLASLIPIVVDTFLKADSFSALVFGVCSLKSIDICLGDTLEVSDPIERKRSEDSLKLLSLSNIRPNSLLIPIVELMSSLLALFWSLVKDKATPSTFLTSSNTLCSSPLLIANSNSGLLVFSRSSANFSKSPPSVKIFFLANALICSVPNFLRNSSLRSLVESIDCFSDASSASIFAFLNTAINPTTAIANALSVPVAIVPPRATPGATIADPMEGAAAAAAAFAVAVDATLAVPTVPPIVVAATIDSPKPAELPIKLSVRFLSNLLFLMSSVA